MGTPVGRIEKEFVFKALVDDGTPCDVHGAGKEARCRFSKVSEERLEMEPVEGTLPDFPAGEEVRIFFYLKNNYHTFSARIVESGPARIVVQHPPGIYKNLQRKYERVKPAEDLQVSFNLKGGKIELNFPKSERFSAVEPPETSTSFDPRRIEELVKEFREKMAAIASENRIVMMRDRLPRTWEEKIMVRLGKCLWIPSTEEDFPAKDPFPEDRVITKGELIRLEEESGAQPYVITGKLGNLLYKKAKKNVSSELLCPILYNEYVVGYLHLWNTGERKSRINKDMVEQAWQFSKMLCYSLVTNGYFKAENASERRYEAPIIDMSASGLLFAHTSADLSHELLVHTDLELTMRVARRTFKVGSRVMRKFRDAENVYFGVLFLKIDPKDLAFLFQYLYGKPFDPAYERVWEGGAPPPALQL